MLGRHWEKTTKEMLERSKNISCSKERKQLQCIYIMERLFMSFVTFTMLFVVFLKPLFASSYVLPYPSAMPGSMSYKVHLAWEVLMKYWYFGSFGQFDYNLKQADKYLVEAKTLFEYQQYLLGDKALEKSNMYFSKTLPYLQQAKREGKDISEKRALLHEAVLKHKDVLETIQSATPATFIWSPEKSPASTLYIHAHIQQSLTQREKYL